MRKLKIGQIGIGHNHGSGKMEAVRKFPELFEIVGYSEEDEHWRRERQDLEAYRGLPLLPVKDLLQRAEAVLVECDVRDLTKYAQMCVDAGKHLHMDKPASGTLEEFQAVLDTARCKELTVQMGYMYRYNPAIRKCVELARSGALGEIYSVTAEMSTFHSSKYRQWLKNFRGGGMYIFGSHLIDLVIYLLGEPQKITVFMKQSGLDGVNAQDNTLAVLEYERALVRVFVSSVEVNGYGRRQFTVCGSKGTVQIMPLENPCVMYYSNMEIADNPYSDRKEMLELPRNCGDRYDEMMQDFYSYCMGRKINPFSYAHDYLVQKVLYEIIDGTA